MSTESVTVRNIGRIKDTYIEKIKDLLWGLGIIERPEDSAMVKIYADMLKTKEIYTVSDLKAYDVSRGGVYKIMNKMMRHGLVAQESRKGEEVGMKCNRWVRVFRARPAREAWEDKKLDQKRFTKKMDELVETLG